MIKQISITATIAAGETTATETSDTTIHGKILKVDVNYPTNTVTVDLDTVGERKSQKILNLAAANTDATYYPRTYNQDETGTDLLYAATGTKIPTEFAVYGKITLSLASGTAEEAVTVGITYED